MRKRKPPRHCIICRVPYQKTGSAKCCSPECSADWVKLKHAKWREDNPEKWGEWSARFREQNPEYMPEYLEANFERIREVKAQWDKDHPDKVREYAKRVWAKIKAERTERLAEIRERDAAYHRARYAAKKAQRDDTPPSV